MKRYALILALLTLALLALAVGRADSADPARVADSRRVQTQAFSLVWWTVDGGGGAASAGSGFTLGGTAGQPDAGTMANSTYTLRGGFWTGGGPAAVGYGVYLPAVFK